MKKTALSSVLTVAAETLEADNRRPVIKLFGKSSACIMFTGIRLSRYP